MPARPETADRDRRVPAPARPRAHRAHARIVALGLTLLVGCSGFVLETPPPWSRLGTAVHCDDSGKWAFADLAIAAAGAFLFVDAGGEGMGAYAATAATVVFGISSIVGFKRTRDCRCLHDAWLAQERLR